MFSPSNSGDSEISDSCISSKSAFRVSISLKRYFKDVRSLCYILVTKNRRVRWLERRLQTIFALPGSFCLRTNGHLLPSSEPLALLRPEDPIEVIPTEAMKAGVTHTTETLHSNVNNLLETQVQNEIKSNNTFHQHCDVNSPASDSNYNEEMSDKVLFNKRMRIERLNSGNSNCELKSRDDVDRAEVPYQCPNNIDLTINNNMNIKEINGCSESIKVSSTLQQLKQQALSLLDNCKSASEVSELNAENFTAPKRTRRRVRRRSRRVPMPEHTQQLDSEGQQELSDDLGLPVSSNFQTLLLEPMISITNALPPMCGNDDDSNVTVYELQSMVRAQTPEVARNEAACSRKPRVVRPIEIGS